MNTSSLKNSFGFWLTALPFSLLTGCAVCPRAVCPEGFQQRGSFIASTQAISNETSLICTLSIDGLTHVAARRPYIIRVELTNDGSQPFDLFEEDELPAILLLTAPDGRPAPLTVFGKQRVEPKSLLSGPNTIVTSRLSRVRKFDLCQIFDLREPGKYRLRVSQPVRFSTGADDKIREVSETVEFFVGE